MRSRLVYPRHGHSIHPSAPPALATRVHAAKRTRPSARGQTSLSPPLAGLLVLWLLQRLHHPLLGRRRLEFHQLRHTHLLRVTASVTVSVTISSAVSHLTSCGEPPGGGAQAVPSLCPRHPNLPNYHDAAACRARPWPAFYSVKRGEGAAGEEKGWSLRQGKGGVGPYRGAHRADPV